MELALSREAKARAAAVGKARRAIHPLDARDAGLARGFELAIELPLVVLLAEHQEAVDAREVARDALVAHDGLDAAWVTLRVALISTKTKGIRGACALREANASR